MNTAARTNEEVLWELFDKPFDPQRHLVPTPRLRQVVLVGACSPSYQRFLRRFRGRCIVLDGRGNTTIVIAGAVKIGAEPPISVEDFLALVARGERPWEREPAPARAEALPPTDGPSRSTR